MLDSEDPWPTDPELYERLAAKEWPAWESLFVRLHPWLVETVRARARKAGISGYAAADAADDVVSELFIRWRNLMMLFDPRRSRPGDKPLADLLRGYIYSSLLNALHSWHSRHRRHAARHSLLVDVESGALTPQEIYDSVELDALISSLPDDERELIKLRFWDSLTFAEIAEHLGVPPSRAYKLVNDVVRKLEDRLT